MNQIMGKDIGTELIEGYFLLSYITISFLDIPDVVVIVLSTVVCTNQPACFSNRR
jgi:hypothetical protein